jgi:methanogenic corrinoid protein MtbC1
MIEAVLSLDGCRCISLGVETPLWDIVLAAGAHRADIVGLSFTGCMNPNQIVDGLTELRTKLSPSVAVWVGGSAPVIQRRRVDGVEAFGGLDVVPAELRRWRAGHSA